MRGASQSMINDLARNAKYYRGKAREIRRFAARSRSSDVRLQLLDLADLFDRVAARVEGAGLNRKADILTSTTARSF